MSDQSILTRHEQAELDRKERSEMKAHIATLEAQVAELTGEVERLNGLLFDISIERQNFTDKFERCCPEAHIVFDIADRAARAKGGA